MQSEQENNYLTALLGILDKESDTLQDDILACLWELNLLTTFEPAEVLMTENEIKRAIEEQKKLVDVLFERKEKVDFWRAALRTEPRNVTTLKEAILNDCPWLTTRLQS